MSDRMKIMIIAHFCDYGEEISNNRFNYLAELMSKHGYDVELVTSSFSHRDKKQRQRVENLTSLYKATLIYEPSYQKNVSFKRLFVSHKVMAKNLKAYLEKSEKPDLVYCAIPSISVADVAARYANKHHIPFFIDVQDLWPEAFQMVFKLPIISNALFLPFRYLANVAYKQADEIIAVSSTYIERALRVNKKIRTGHSVYLGTSLESFDKNIRQVLPIPKMDGEVWLGYCGTLGASYDIPSVLRALSILKQKGCMEKIVFVIMGDGDRRSEFGRLADDLAVNAKFTGKLPYDRMCAVLHRCDIVINPIVGGSAASIINKHADYAACGRPVINTQESKEYRELVDNYEMGINCTNGNIHEIADAINRLVNDADLRMKMGKNARRCAEERFDRSVTYMEIIKTIEEKQVNYSYL